MHEQFPRSLDKKLVDKKQSYRWLKLEALSEIQKVNQWRLRIRHSAQTTLSKRKVKQEIVSKYRPCKEHEETTDH